MWDSVKEFVLYDCVCNECEISLPHNRMLGHSEFDDSFGRVDDASSEITQEIIFLGGILMWNDASVCGGRMELIVL